MAKIYENLSDLVGGTPLLALDRLCEAHGVEGRILGKLEYFNPSGSVKDRIARNIIEQAEREGLLRKGSVIIEPTSGNTGIALASLAASKGYRVILTVPDIMGMERRNLLSAYGAEIILTDGTKGMKGAVERAKELAEQYPGAFIPSQFENMANPEAHRTTTGPEIWEDTGGKVDIFVAGVGTGGTLSGTGDYLKTQNPSIKVVAVEPAASPVLTKGVPGPHRIQGLGAGFIPKTLDTSIYNEVITVTDEEAYATAKDVMRWEGIFAGVSSGAAIFAALDLAGRRSGKGKNIVAVLPDTGERCLSTPMFAK